MKETTLQISGMSCTGCENTVKQVITQLNGISGAVADYRTGKAVVLFDPSKLNIDQIINAVNEIGYQVESTVTK